MYRNHFFHLHTRSKKIKKKHSKNTSNSLQKPLKNQSQTKFKQRPRKSAPKSALNCEKVPKMVQNGVPKRREGSTIFRYFLSIGTPLGTHMAPRASKRGPRKPPSLNFASFWHPFSHIFATTSTLSSHIFAADFLHFFK